MKNFLRFLYLVTVVGLFGCVTLSSMDRKRIVETGIGRISFELPSPATRISEHRELPSATGGGAYWYGEYDFHYGTQRSLKLQVIVHSKMDVRFSTPDEQLKSAIQETRQYNSPFPSGKILKTIKICGREVSIIEIQQFESKSMRAQVPFKKGAIIFYIKQEFDEQQEEILIPFEGILRSIRF